jgi:hypothetical protein
VIGNNAVIGNAAEGKPKTSAAANYAASVVPSAGSGAPAQNINKDAKFLAER